MYINNRLKGLISMNIEKNIQEIPIEDIIPNRFQPRLMFNEDGLNELSESIKQHGIIQPLVVRKLGDKFEIIAGERRYKAATQAGLTKVPVIISNIDDNKSAEVALVENIQRRNLTAIEEAKSYKNLLDRGYMTQEQLASKMGVSQSAIANKLRLLNLDPEVQDALLNEKISERHARALLSLDSKEEQKKWLQKILNERMTVRQLDMELKKLKEKGTDEDAGIPLVNINPNYDDILNNAEDINAIRAPHDVASMLTPQTPEKKEERIEMPSEPQKMPNKFFNFLEDEQANMDIGDSDELFNNFEPLNNYVEATPKADVEVLDDINSVNPIASEMQPVIEATPKVEELNDELVTPENQDPFSTIFFNNNEIQPTPVIEASPKEEIHSQEMIDPMDSVITLDPNYEEMIEEQTGTDLKSAINTIRETIDNLNKKGFAIEIEEADLEDLYHITIKINKNK